MLKRGFLAIFVGAGTPLADAEHYWFESRVGQAVSGDHISVTGSVDSTATFLHQGPGADETPVLDPRRPRAGIMVPRQSRMSLNTVLRLHVVISC